MSGKISANLSTPSLQALRAERQEGGKISSFWDKWSNLSTGQKWGRALAWVFPPLGISLQAGANLWQARQAKAAAARPMDSQISLSADRHNGIPLKGSVVFGKADRDMARGVLEPDLNKQLSVIQEGDQNYPAEMVGLPEQFAKDLKRKPNHSLQSHNGKSTVHIKPDSEAANRPREFRNFFKQEFPGDSNKADQWAVFASKFLNQNGAAPTLTVTANNHGYAVPSDNISYNLKMENGGNSALVEIHAKGRPNELPGIDSKNSKVENFLLMRITLGPPEDLTVLSGYANHHLVPKQPSENSEVENAAPVQQAHVNQSIGNAEATRLLRNFALGEFDVRSDRFTKLNDFKRQLLNEGPLDFTAFKDAFTQLDEPGSQQKLIGELAGVIKDKERSQYMDLARESDEPDMIMKRQMLSDIRLEEDYPLSTRNAINPEKGPVVKNARDLDIQNFVNRKFEEEVAQKHLGVPADQFFTIIKEGMGPEAILTTGYLNKKELPPALEALRTELLQAFNQATTLDDFYSRAGKIIDQARLESA